jgi:hypothetical protein
LKEKTLRDWNRRRANNSVAHNRHRILSDTPAKRDSSSRAIVEGCFSGKPEETDEVSGSGQMCNSERGENLT